MKKFTTELSDCQGKVYYFLIKNTYKTGLAFVELLNELDGGSFTIPDTIYKSYTELTEVEKVEVIYFVSKHFLRKNG